MFGELIFDKNYQIYTSFLNCDMKFSKKHRTTEQKPKTSIGLWHSKCPYLLYNAETCCQFEMDPHLQLIGIYVVILVTLA